MPNPTPNLSYVEVPGQEIQEVIWGKLMPALEGTRSDAAILGMLTFCILLMKEDVSMEQLQAAVQAATETIVLHITPVPPSQAN